MSFREISCILFDFGGTLDADGWHWLDRFYHIYPQLGLEKLTKDAIKEAFYWADAQADLDPGIRTCGYREMMQRHVRWQFQKLNLKDEKLEARAADAFTRGAERVLHRNFKILETLAQSGIRLGIVSNFYGNIDTLVREFGYNKFMKVIADSAIVGLKKPDPKLYAWALDQLHTPAARAAFVGDSFDRDIVPAKALGMKTFWLLGDHPRPCPDPVQIDVTLRSLEELPQYFERHAASSSTRS